MASIMATQFRGAARIAAHTRSTIHCDHHSSLRVSSVRFFAGSHPPDTLTPSTSAKSGSSAGEDKDNKASPASAYANQAAAAATPPVSASDSALSKPIKNLRDAMEALDILVEEAEKKMEKKYRPNVFAEFKALNDTDGKIVEGPAQLVSVDKAPLLPPLAVTSIVGSAANMETLVSKNGKHATLVLTSFKNYGLEMLPAWREPFQQEFANQNVQVVTLNVIEDWYMKLVQGSILKGLQEKTPVEHHAATFAHFGRCDDFRTVMDLNNSFVGYVHLVDSKGRIRWIAAGPATPKELQRLFKLTKELLVQQKQKSQQRR